MDKRTVRELSAKEAFDIGRNSIIHGNLDIEHSVIVPVTIGYATSYQKDTDVNEVLELEISVDEIRCPFLNMNHAYPIKDFDYGPGSEMPCVGFYIWKENDGHNHKHQCPYFARVNNFSHLEIVCSGNFKK